MAEENGGQCPSMKLQRDDSRRKQFKARSRDLERGVSAPTLSPTSETKAPLPLSKKEAITVGQSQGHQFQKKTFFQPTFCHHCTELLWGLKGQGMKCPGNTYRLRDLPLSASVRARWCIHSLAYRASYTLV